MSNEISNELKLEAEVQKLKSVLNNLQGKIGGLEIYIAELEESNKVLSDYYFQTEKAKKEEKPSEDKEKESKKKGE